MIQFFRSIQITQSEPRFFLIKSQVFPRYSLIEPEQDYEKFGHGPLPVLLPFESPEKEYAGIAKEILALLQQGFLPQEIVILQRHRTDHDKLGQELRRRGIPSALVRGNLDLAEPAVKICTFHSAKGLEFEVVFICGLESFRINQPVETGSQEFQQLLDQERKLLYVGMTRALHHLQRRRPGVDFQPAAGQAAAAPAHGVRTVLKWGGLLAEFEMESGS